MSQDNLHKGMSVDSAEDQYLDGEIDQGRITREQMKRRAKHHDDRKINMTQHALKKSNKVNLQ